MIRGIVNNRLQPTIRVILRGLRGRTQEVQAVVDTGYNGALTLPSSLIASLHFRWRTVATVELANGTIDRCDVHAGTVIWDGKPKTVLIEASEAVPLVGMRLVHRYELRAHIVAGGLVTIKPILRRRLGSM